MKKYLPYWMRRRLSCPDCGWSPPFGGDYEWEVKMEFCGEFICPRCEARYGHQDFFAENQFKYSKEADLEFE